MKKTGVFANGLIWFGAAVSIAEIEAGCSMGGHWAALVAGHLFGGVLLFAAGLLGATSGKNAMETTVSTFGSGGMRLFAALNVLQLVGWTSVMIAQGGAAVSELTGLPVAVPCLALAVLVGVWRVVAFGERVRFAAVAMGALAVLAAVLTVRLIGVEGVQPVGGIGFWNAFEISVAMPLSWLPLVSDYSSAAERPRLATAVSAGVYTVTSAWMYAIGILLASIGAGSVADGIVKTGLGVAGLAIIVFSTVTTTFLDAYSAGVSANSVVAKVSPKGVGLAVCAIGGALAIGGVMDHYLGFLYLISSVFAPMAAVLLVDRYALRRTRVPWNLGAWLAGFLAYQFAGDSPIGPTLTAILVSAGLTFAQRLLKG